MLALPIDALGGHELTGGEDDPLPARTWTTAEAPAIRRGATMYVGIFLADSDLRVLDQLTDRSGPPAGRTPRARRSGPAAGLWSIPRRTGWRPRR